ncbi:MAG: helix-turn-helix domain-containing protein, partial [Trebonia sp.]
MRCWPGPRRWALAARTSPASSRCCRVPLLLPRRRPGEDWHAARSRARGRPRSERARRAVLEAVAGLLLERGLSAVSMDAVAERAGVSKATIYRW